MPAVDFYYDYVSPYAYLAFTQRGRLIEAGAKLGHRPMFLGALIAKLGALPGYAKPGKNRWPYIIEDLRLWAKRYGVPLNMPHTFPVNTLPLLRGAYLAQQAGCIDAYSARCFDAVWVHDEAVSSPEVGMAIAEEVGLDPQQWLAVTQNNDIKMRLKGDTDGAMERGVFGAPFFFVGERRFWGNDRLGFVLDAIREAGA